MAELDGLVEKKAWNFYNYYDNSKLKYIAKKSETVDKNVAERRCINFCDIFI